MTQKFKKLTVAWAIAFSAVQMASAQPVAPVLSTLSTDSLQAGHSIEIILTGSSLDTVSTIALPNAQGLTAELIKAEPQQARIKVAAAPDAEPGVREVRLMGPHGATNGLNLHITAYPPVYETEPNNLPTQSQSVNLPAVLIGRIESPGDVDRYSFTAAKGQQLVIDVRAARDRSELDAVISLYNDQGREVAASNDHFGRDPFIAYTVPAAGTYTLGIRDLKYRGAVNYGYRITAGPVPYIVSVFPPAAQQGTVARITPRGYNLPEGKTIELSVPSGLDEGQSLPVKASAASGDSINSLPVTVVEIPTVLETEPNDAATGQAVQIPAAINGTLGQRGDVDTFSFTLDKAMKLEAEVLAARFNSPVDALLTLSKADGTLVARNDDAAGADAKIVADLQPGSYTVSVQDLLYGGGPSHVYLLSLRPEGMPRHDFAVRFLPDTPRIARGGHAMFWCEVARMNGFNGDVTLAIEGLPPGVTCDPVTLNPATSGVFTIAASTEAPLGTFPIKVIATAPLRNKTSSRTAQPEAGAVVVQQAYLTVLGAAPFTVKAMDVTPQQLEKYGMELDELEEKLSVLPPELASAMTEWENTIASQPKWVTLKPTDLKSVNGVRFFPQPDGSVIAGPPFDVERETFTIGCETDIKGITAVRLDVIPHPNLPNKGPGRAVNGNFVLSTFEVVASNASNADESSKLEFAEAFADFSQPGLNPNTSLDADDVLGWAIADQFGKEHWAIFPVKQAFGYESGTRISFVMKQNFGQRHIIGGFRLSVTTHEKPGPGTPLPREVADALAILPDQRDETLKKLVTRHFLSTTPQTADLRARAELLRSIVGPSRQIAQLEARMKAPDEKVDAAQKLWESAVLTASAPKLSTWHVAGPFQARTNPLAFTQEFGPETQLKKGKVNLESEYGMDKIKWAQKPEYLDGQVHVLGATARSSTYLHRAVHVDVPMVVSVSLGSDDGIKFWHNGKLVLSNEVYRAPAPDQEKVSLNLLPGENTLLLKIANGESASGFYFKLADSPTIPEDVSAALKQPAESRSAEQTARVREYYRSIDPALQPTRDKLAQTRSQFSSDFPPVLSRTRPQALSVLVEPNGDFKSPVKVSLEGFSLGRDPKTNQPAPLTKNIGYEPATVQPSEGGFGILVLTPTAASEIGRRMVVLKAEGESEGVKWTQYSPAFPLTVKE